MLEVEDYILIEKIYESEYILVYRAIRKKDQSKVILKIGVLDSSSIESIQKLKNEYENLCNLKLQGVLKVYDFFGFGGYQILVMEDIDGNALRKMLPRISGDLDWFFTIAIELAKSLNLIHDHNIIHCDIKPENIIINLENKIIRISDFGFSIVLPQKYSSYKIDAGRNLFGTLEYMSPEQTGWTNRPVDYRTDYYSLGITLYEILTGKTPFESEDNLELLHMQLAQSPVPPIKIRPEIPEFLSEIILKLISKNAEDRYQSIFGLISDLKICQDAFINHQVIKNISTGQNDINDTYMTPSLLYGRRADIDKIREIYKKPFKRNNKILIIEGDTGTGKSSIIQESIKDFISNRSFFASAVFEESSQKISYHGITDIIAGLVNQVLIQDTKSIEEWKKSIKNIDFQSGGLYLLTSISAKLENLIGIPKYNEPLEKYSVFNQLVHSTSEFLNLFSKEKSLVIIFDELQYADSPTIRLIEALIFNAELKNTFFIFTYNDKRKLPDKLIKSLIERIKKESVSDQISLSNLTDQDITQWMKNSFNCDKVKCKPLINLLIQKTNGNPFFLKQFLESIYNDGLIFFNKKEKTWKWKLDKILNRESSENVIDLWLYSINRLDEDERKTLNAAACIGEVFSIQKLTFLLEISAEKVIEKLKKLQLSGLIIKQIEHLYNPETNRGKRNFFDDIYKFCDPHIYEFINQTVNAEFKIRMSLKIGRLLFKENTQLYQRTFKDWQLFICKNNSSLFLQFGKNIPQILFYFNNSSELIEDTNEKNIVGILNLLAADDCIKTAAYEDGWQFFKKSSELIDLSQTGIIKEFYLIYNVKFIEILYLSGQYKQSEKKALMLLNQSENLLNKLVIYKHLVIQYTTTKQWKKAIDFGAKGLLLAGINLLTNERQKRMEALKKSVDKEIINVPLNKLSKFPVLKNPEKRETLEIMMQMVSPVYSVQGDLSPLLIFNMISFSLKYGFNEFTSYALITYGVLLGSTMGKYKEAQAVSILALKLNDKLKGLNVKCRLNVSYAFNINHWRNPLEESFLFLIDAFNAGRRMGDYLWTGYSIVALLKNKFLKGISLNEILSDIGKFGNYPEVQNSPIKGIVETIQLVIFDLHGNKNDTDSINTRIFNEQKFLKSINKNANHHTIHWYHLCKMQLYYIHEKNNLAEKHIKLSEKFLTGALGSFSVAEHYFYKSLIYLNKLPQANYEKKKQYEIEVLEAMSKLKNWANHCPENFRHKYLLLDAEYKSFKNLDMNMVMNLYDDAIRYSTERFFFQDQAIANECAARYFFRKNKPLISRIYIKEAVHAWIKWGAEERVRELKEKYPEFLSGINIERHVFSSTKSTYRRVSQEFDFASLIKVSQNISNEIDLDKLIENLVAIMMENAGAQIGFLFLKQSGTLALVVKCTNEKGAIQCHRPKSGNVDKILAMTLVNYVNSTLEPIILNTNQTDNIWKMDPYIQKYSPKSICCLPVVKGNNLIAIIYLENRIASGIFTPEKLDILKILLSQATISLENSMYVEKVKKINEELAKEISERKNTEEQLRYDSLHDSLTNLPNWTLFLDRLQNTIRRIERSNNYQYSVILMDIDRFKLINDSFGHDKGNKLIILISNILAKCTRPGDTLARLGGDEFVILLESIDSLTKVLQIVDRIRNALKEPILLDNHQLYITVSMGIVIGNVNYTRAEHILRDADAALHRAKEKGKNTYEIFDPSMHVQAVKFLQTERDIRKGIKLSEFKVFGQPIYSIQSQKMQGFEALLRWKHPEYGLVPPLDFIPVAESTGLIHELGKFVLNEACEFNCRLNKRNNTNSIVAVNISAIQFQHENIVKIIRDILKSTGMDPGLLELEITEGLLMKDLKRATEIVKELKDLGIKFAIDDFGTGYSSLSYLSLLPVDRLKIDKSFIDNITSNKDNYTISKTIITMGHSLNLRITAEGVESTEQFDILAQNGCDEIQGYFYSKPAPLDDLYKFEPKLI